MLFLAYLCIGAVAGLLAGLFGVGGGTIIVPMLLWLLPLSGVPQEHVMTVALGTSFATIVFTAMSSAKQHHALGNVDFRVFGYLVPSIMLSVFVCGWIVTYLPKALLIKLFALMMLFLAIKMFRSHHISIEAKPLTVKTQIWAGLGIGALSSFAGIGGGSFIVPFLYHRGFEMKRAIGTSSACGVLLGLAATISFMLSGLSVNNLPSYTVGYVYLPAFLGIVVASIITSKMGANLAHRLPVNILKKAFAVFLCFVSINLFLK